jgi:hypothetical protein
MPNNLFTGFNIVRATETIGFAAAGLNSGNCLIVFEVDGAILKSWVPTRTINAVTTFTDGKGYYIVMTADADLSAYLIPPVPSGGDVTWADIGGTISENAELQSVLDSLSDAITEALNEAKPEVVATKASISAATRPRLISVTIDETNNSEQSLYFFDGTTLKQIQTF